MGRRGLAGHHGAAETEWDGPAPGPPIADRQSPHIIEEFP
ncbi:hypothetical protein KPATCC21470_7375 [Kitasatospora purpeofusca]